MVYFNDTVDAAFSALADPTRRAIVSRLLKGERPIGVLAEPFDMSLPAVSKHIRVLEETGLVRIEKRGRTRWCQLQPETFQAADAWLAPFRAFWDAELDQMERYLNAPAGSPTEMDEE